MQAANNAASNGRWLEAEKNWQQVLDVEPDNAQALCSLGIHALHRGDNEEWTTVGGEMRLLGAYLEIERLRWGELLDVELECPPELEGEPLPYFLLLPLVENALKYGRSTSPDRVGVVVRVRRGGDGSLVLEVGNTGAWLEPSRRKSVVSLGIGLDNLRRRLARHYAGRHRIDIAPAAGWVWVALRLVPESSSTSTSS